MLQGVVASARAWELLQDVVLCGSLFGDMRSRQVLTSMARWQESDGISGKFDYVKLRNKAGTPAGTSVCSTTSADLGSAGRQRLSRAMKPSGIAIPA
jgi:hypothetical protein